MARRLAGEASPYLLQHKDNPVDWYPWGPEALQAARDGDRPILLSIGYSACHWCHVMERESFEDPGTADLMNRSFVNIKVDREERPDIDSIYMDALQSMSGHGGWPMTMFLTPDGRPFYGGTYFPPEDRHGMPAFRKVLSAISEAWTNKRDEIERQGTGMLEHLRKAVRIPEGERAIRDDIVDEAVKALEGSFDEEYGGFGAAPKFPQAMVVDLLLARAVRGDRRAGDMAQRTLDAMSAGGMFDQLGGGFARYSVDRYWLVPHFEKMLYDNAQLLRTYARSFRIAGNERHLEVAEMTVSWLDREMTDPAGGLWSALDADSEGEEGRFYVFTHDEVRSATGADFDDAKKWLGISGSGNFEGKNIPIRAGDIGGETRERIRRSLLELRSERVRPGTDDKVLTGWNALAASALASSGALLGRASWIERAGGIMDFIRSTLCVDGRLMRSYRGTNGDPVIKHLGYAEDYAFFLEASLVLFEATGDRSRLDDARWAADEAIRLFSAPEGGFFSTGSDAETLIVRPKELLDNAIPSANSVFAHSLQRLAQITGERSYDETAVSAMASLSEAAARTPLGFGQLLQAIDFHNQRTAEVVIVSGESGDREMVEVVNSDYRPNQVLVRSRDGSTLDIPLLKDRGAIGGRTTAYVCHEGVCELPVTDAEALRRLLENA